jgi:hypothetical protein
MLCGRGARGYGLLKSVAMSQLVAATTVIAST